MTSFYVVLSKTKEFRGVPNTTSLYLGVFIFLFAYSIHKIELKAGLHRVCFVIHLICRPDPLNSDVLV